MLFRSRVPAAFNGIVGIKPSKGLVSTRGVVPACRTLDCVTVFARDVTTARAAYEQMVGYDAEDPYARRLEQRPVPATCTIGVPDLPLDLDPEHAAAWAEALTEAEALGEVRRIDVRPFLEAAQLLYSGPWLAERWLAFGDALDDDDAVDPTVRSIVRDGASLTAADAFAGLTRLAELARQTFYDTFAATNDATDMALHLAKAYGVPQQSGEIADPSISTLLAEEEGAVIAYAQLRDDHVPSCVTGPAPIELWRFYVSREWHGRGVARLLMDRAMEIGRAHV